MTTQPQRTSHLRALFAGLAMTGLVSGCAVSPDGRIVNLAGEPMFRVYGNQYKYRWDAPGAAVVVHSTGTGYTHYDFDRGRGSYRRPAAPLQRRLNLWER